MLTLKTASFHVDNDLAVLLLEFFATRRLPVKRGDLTTERLLSPVAAVVLALMISPIIGLLGGHCLVRSWWEGFFLRKVGHHLHVCAPRIIQGD